MMEKNGNGNGTPKSKGQFTLQKIYIKDMSFEAPNSPDVFIDGKTDQITPQLQLDLKNSHTDLPNEHYEVVLHIGLHATAEDRTLFMVEIDQAGIFLIKGYNTEDYRALIGTHCLSTLFPFAREELASIIGKGGFPAILLQPINFESLFAQAMLEQAENA